MEIKRYDLYQTKKKSIKANNLIESPRESGVCYDFSLLDTIQFKEDYEKEMLIDDIMRYTEYCWYDQPLPTIIIWNTFTHYVGQIRTAYRRVFNKQGKRIMVIVEVTKIHIEKQTRPDTYTQTMTTQYSYDAECYRWGNQGDEEVAS